MSAEPSNLHRSHQYVPPNKKKFDGAPSYYSHDVQDQYRGNSSPDTRPTSWFDGAPVTKTQAHHRSASGQWQYFRKADLPRSCVGVDDIPMTDGAQGSLQHWHPAGCTHQTPQRVSPESYRAAESQSYVWRHVKRPASREIVRRQQPDLAKGNDQGSREQLGQSLGKVPTETLLLEEDAMESLVSAFQLLQDKDGQCNLAKLLREIEGDWLVRDIVGPQKWPRLLQALRTVSQKHPQTNIYMTFPAFVNELESAAAGPDGQAVKHVPGRGLILAGEVAVIPGKEERMRQYAEEAQKKIDAISYDQLRALLVSNTQDYVAPNLLLREPQLSLPVPDLSSYSEQQRQDRKTSTDEEIMRLSNFMRDMAVVRQSRQERRQQDGRDVPIAKLTDDEAVQLVERRLAEAAVVPKYDPVRLKRRKLPLTPQQEQEVERALTGRAGEVLLEAHNVQVTREKLRCLRPMAWLNDEVINLIMKFLQERDDLLCVQKKGRRPSWFTSSFFLAKLTGQDYKYANVKRWTKKVDVFAMDKLFFPTNVSNVHWCLTVVYVQEKRIQYFDSMGGAGTSYTQVLLRWLQDEHWERKKEKLDPAAWKIVGTQQKTPQQTNGSDCGVFTCVCASYISEDLPLAYTQEEMELIRKKICWALLHKTVEHADNVI